MKTNKPSPVQENLKPIITRKTITVGPIENQSSDTSVWIGAIVLIILFVICFMVSIKTHTKSIKEINLIVAEPASKNKKIEKLFEKVIFLSPVPAKTPIKENSNKKNHTYKKLYTIPNNYHAYDDIIVKEASAIKANPAIIKAIIEQESRYQHNVFKYESKWESRYGKNIPKKNGENLRTWRMNFSSIGLMQIGYALHKDFCDLNSYTDLLNPKINIKCGVKLFGQCLESGLSENQCIKRHNGSGPMAEAYKNQVLNRVARIKVLDSDRMVS